MVKNLPAMQETWVRSLGWEDPLEEGIATHSSILAWRIPMDRGAWRATVHWVSELDMTERQNNRCASELPGKPSEVLQFIKLGSEHVKTVKNS